MRADQARTIPLRKIYNRIDKSDSFYFHFPNRNQKTRAKINRIFQAQLFRMKNRCVSRLFFRFGEYKRETQRGRAARLGGRADRFRRGQFGGISCRHLRENGVAEKK